MATMETIGKIKQMIADGVLTQEDAEKYFPELKDGEDEKIKKWLYNIIENGSYLGEIPFDKNLVLAWIEKQGEQKHTDVRTTGYWYVEDIEQKSANKVEHRFKVGDSIKTTNEEPLTITKITDSGYWSEDLFICDFNEECLWDLVEQKPAWSEDDEKKTNYLIGLLQINTTSNLALRITNEGLENWLKELKDRCTWKPSKEQIIALRWVLNNVPYNKHKEEISGLIEQIKDFV